MSFPAPRKFSRRSGIPTGAAALVMFISLVALMGWWLKIPRFTSFISGWPTMKFNTALAMLLAAVALLLASVERRQPKGRGRTFCRVIGWLLAAWPLFFGGLTLMEYATGKNLGLDQIFSRDFLSAPNHFPGRPAPATACGLVLTGLVLWSWRQPRALVFFSCCVGTVLGLAWLALTGLLYGVYEKAGTLLFGTLSLPTSLGFFSLAIGLLFLRPREGLGRLFTQSNHAGQLARRLVPLAVVLTVGLGGLQLWAQVRWHFSTELGVALYGTGMLISLVLVALRGAWRVDRVDLQRRGAEQRTRRELAAREATLLRLEESDARLAASEQRFRGIFNSAFNFMGLLAPDGTILEANQTALDLIGTQSADMLGRPFAETPWWAHSEVEQARLRAGIERAAQGQTVRFETSHPDDEGRMHYVDFTLKPVFDAAGRVVQLVPEGRDITERKQAEAAL